MHEYLEVDKINHKVNENFNNYYVISPEGILAATIMPISHLKLAKKIAKQRGT